MLRKKHSNSLQKTIHIHRKENLIVDQVNRRRKGGYNALITTRVHAGADIIVKKRSLGSFPYNRH